MTESFGNGLSVIYLGDVDLKTPLASMVVSQTVKVARFDQSLHKGRNSCILSVTGCDLDVLKSAGLYDASVPLLSLPHIFSSRRQIDGHGYTSFSEFAKQYSLPPKSVSEFYKDQFEQSCQDVEETALFLSDCVVALANVIAQISKSKKISII